MRTPDQTRPIRVAGLADDARQGQAIERARAMLMLRDRVAGIATDARTSANRTTAPAVRRRASTRALRNGRWPASIRAEDLALGE